MNLASERCDFHFQAEEAGLKHAVRNNYTLKTLPTNASYFLLKHTQALGIKFTPAKDIYDVLPNVPIDESSVHFLLPQLSSKANLLTIYDNLITDSSLSGTNKVFIKKLFDVVTNSSENIGTEESKTESLVDDMLRSVGLNNWPLALENHPKFIVDIGEQRISAVPEFVVRQYHAIPGHVCIVVEDKHIKNVSRPSGFGESQISMEILCAAYGNFNGVNGIKEDQTLYAIRVISNYVTFYRATVKMDYLNELTLGTPKKSTLEICRFPGINEKDSGLDLVDVVQRKVALCGMTILGIVLA